MVAISCQQVTLTQIIHPARLDPTVGIKFCPESSHLVVVDRLDRCLVTYSVLAGSLRIAHRTSDIFGDWAVSEVHDLRVSPTQVQLLVRTHGNLLGLIEVDMEMSTGRRRLLAALHGENIGSHVRLNLHRDLHSKTDGDARIIISSDILVDMSSRLDPAQAEERYKPQVVYISKQALGPWIAFEADHNDEDDLKG